MSCSIERNNKGRITNVKTPKGENSKLFQEVHNNPFLGDADMSYKIHSAQYTDAHQELFKGASEEFVYDTKEPKLFTKDSAGNIHDSLEQAILDNSGAMEIGFVNPNNGSFIKIASFDTQASKKSRFLESQIKEGVLSTERTLMEDGVTRLKGKGSFRETSRATAEILKNNLINDYGVGNIKIHPDGSIDVNFNEDFATVKFKSGGTKVMSFDDVLTLTNPENIENYVDILSQAIAYKVSKNISVDGNVSSATAQEIALATNQLYSFLNKLGFTVTTLENYRKNYSDKYGKEPDINAIADLANKVVAFADGRLTISELSEEVAHIAIEAYNEQNSIDEALELVHATPEWTMHADYYRSIYSKNLEGQELENRVRKEVLGKVLAKQISKRFDTSGMTENHSSVVTFLKNLWDRFSNYISQTFKPQYVRELNKLTNDITDSILSQQMEDFQNSLEDNDTFFYNATSKQGKTIQSELKNMRDALMDSFNSSRSSSYRRADIEKIYDTALENEMASSINTITDVLLHHVKVMEDTIKLHKQGKRSIDHDDITRLEMLKENGKTYLPQLKYAVNKAIKDGIIKDVKYDKIMRDQVKIMESINGRITDVLNEIDENNEDFGVDVLIAELNRTGATEETKKKVIDNLKQPMRDTTLLGAWLQPNTSTKNPFFGAILNIFARIHNHLNQLIKEEVNPILQKYTSDEIRKFDKNLFERDENGNKTGYIKGFVKRYLNDRQIKENQIKILSELSNQSETKIKSLLKSHSPQEILNDDKLYSEYNKRNLKFRQDKGLRPMTEEYYEKSEGRFKQGKLSDDTISTIRSLNADVATILNKYRTKGSRSIDKSKMSVEDKTQLVNIKNRRDKIKSPYDEVGNVRDGLSVKRASNLTQSEKDFLKTEYGLDFNDTLKEYKGNVILISKNTTREDLDLDARRALDMYNLDMIFMQERHGKGRGKVTNEFNDKVEELDNKKDGSAFDWIMDNANIAFSEEYYGDNGETSSFTEQVEKFANEMEDVAESEDILTELDHFKSLSNQHRSLLRKYKKAGSYIETDVNNIPDPEKAVLIHLENEMNKSRKAIFDMMPSEFDYEKAEGISQREPNDDYFKMLEDSGLSEADFAMEHMSDSNKADVQRFIRSFTAYAKGERTKLSNYHENFVDETNQLFGVEIDANGNITNLNEVIEKASGLYARSKVAGYMHRYVPEGYDVLLDAMKKGEVNMLDVINKDPNLLNKFSALKYLDVRPDYSWTEDIANEGMMNKDFMPAQSHVNQLGREYFNKETADYYGIKEEDYWNLQDGDISKLTATRNVREFEYLCDIVALNKQSLIDNELDMSISEYRVPQISKGGFEKVFGAGRSITRINDLTAIGKDMFSDIIQDKPDELEFGEMRDGVSLIDKGIKKIPKYFVRELEDQNMLSDNLLHMVALNRRQSINYSLKKGSFNEVNALMANIKNRNYKTAGGGKTLKKGEVSNVLKKADEFVNYYLYGIKQNVRYKFELFGKEIEMSKLVGAINQFGRHSHLAFHPIVAMTGALTSRVTRGFDVSVSEYYSFDSVVRAKGIITPLLGKSSMEYGKSDQRSHLSSLMEAFSASDFLRRTKESSFGRIGRMMQSSPYGDSRMLQIPVYAENIVSILADVRYVDGQFIGYPQFRQMNKDKSLAQIKALWSKYKNDSLWDNIKVDANGVHITNEFISKFKDKATAEKEFERLKDIVSNKARIAQEGQDAMLNEFSVPMANRNMLANSVLIHKGWALINFDKRFKGRQFNYQTGIEEEGHYISLMKLLSSLINGEAKRLSKNGTAGILQSAWGQLDIDQKRNVKRSGIESGVLLTLLAIGGAIFGGKDDEDDELGYFDQMARLLYLRTTNEIASANPITFSGTIMQSIENPFPNLSTYRLLEPVSMTYDTFQYDKDYGSKAVRKLFKGTFLTRYNQYSDLNLAIRNYRHYNDATLFNLGSKKAKTIFEGLFGDEYDTGNNAKGR